MKPVKIIKNRSDIGAGTRGADMGIDAMEVAAITAGNDFFTRYAYEDVMTHNETVYDKVKAPFAKRITFVREQCERVCQVVTESLSEDYLPVILSGDHSSALGTISGIKAFWPECRLGIVWIDAHADLHSPYTSPSGNIHGMPLAAAMSIDNTICQVNTIKPETRAEWIEMKQMGNAGQKVRPEDLVYFGVRDTESPEDQLIERLEIRNYPVHEVRYRGLKTCVDEVLTRLEPCDLIYISFDVDSLDCDLVSKGTGTPVSKGFDPNEVIAIINRLMKTKKVACLEFVEVNPLLDTKGNKMAETAFEVLDSISF